MPTYRDNPYSTFNFLVALGGDQGDGSAGAVIGGFSEATGLGVDIEYAEYRNGNEMINTVRKVPGIHTNDDVTLKRGLIGSTDIFNWMKGVREGTPDPRNLTITLLDEAREAVATWVLRQAQPKKWTGPSFNAKGGGDVAMEEISFVCEGVDYS
jgi:phage tail-like protein